MGKVVEKKKKKGRPSLLDLQRRRLKEQSQTQDHGGRDNSAPKPTQNHGTATTTPVRRSTRRNPASDGGSSPDERDGEEDSSPRRRRREKKLKLVLRVPNSGSGGHGGSDSGAEEDADAAQNQKKRKIAAIGDGSGGGASSEKGDKPAKSANVVQASARSEPGASTPLPDKKLLLFILDRLQKKDTYGVFSEPVDPEELPDYHDIIAHPMDFGTVRKKLNGGTYANLEEFESDVFLICSNAMQYNAPDTVYFRQARSIQELARKNFDSLRQESDDNEPRPKVVKRGRPPTKHLKRPPGRPPLDRGGSSNATLATGGDSTKGQLFGDRSSLMNDTPGRPRSNNMYPSWLSENRFERNNDNAGSSANGGLMKLGKQQTVPDEDRRNTYKQYHPSTLGRGNSVLATFDREWKQLLAVGLQSEHGYARSLAYFAANLGPVAWKIASRMIEKSLPADVKFGPGWVGENGRLPPRRFQLSSPAPSSLWPFSRLGSSDAKDLDDCPADPEDNLSEIPQKEHSYLPEKHRPFPPPSENHSQPTEMDERSTSERSPLPIYKNGFTGPFGSYNNNVAAAQVGKSTGAKPSSGFHFRTPSSVEANSHHHRPVNNIVPDEPRRSPPPHRKPEPGQPHQPRPVSASPDLNIRFHSPGSPHTSRADSAQPDLALQL